MEFLDNACPFLVESQAVAVLDWLASWNTRSLRETNARRLSHGQAALRNWKCLAVERDEAADRLPNHNIRLGDWKV